MFRFIPLTCLLLTLAVPSQGKEVLKTRFVAATATQAPGMPAGITMESLTSDTIVGPVLSEDGKAAFTMGLVGEGVVAGQNDMGLYVWKPDGTYTLVARRGEQAPGAPDGTLWHKLIPQGFSADGQLSFGGTFMVGGGGGVTATNEHYAYVWDSTNGLQLVAREGSQASGNPAAWLLGEDKNYLQPTQLGPRITPDGVISFWHALQMGEITGVANFVGLPGAIDVRGPTGLLATGIAGLLVHVGYGTVPVMNDNGQVANCALLGASATATSFVTAIAGPGIGAPFQVIQRDNEAVPGVPTAKFLPLCGSTENYDIAGNGSVSFVGTYWEGPTFRYGLFKSDPLGNPSAVLLGGTHAPGLAENATIDVISAHGMMSDGRIMVLLTALYDADGWGGYSSKERVFYVQEEDGTFTPVVREGQPAPGMGGALFGAPNNSFAANQNGEVVFASQLYGIVMPPNTNNTIWLYTPGKGLRLVLQSGTKITVAPGDERTISVAKVSSVFATVSFRTSGRHSNLNNSGLMGVSMSFLETNPTPGTHPVSNSGMALAWFEEAGNTAPVANDDTYAAGEETPLTIDAPGFLANDSDADGETLTASLVGFPSGGSLGVNANGSFVYTPGPGFVGFDSFEYEVCDPSSACDTGTVLIEVLGKTACTGFDCNTVTGCEAVPLVCDDQNACTQDLCDPTQGCLFAAAECGAGDKCNVWGCDTQTGCFVVEPVVCDDGNPCTLDQCAPASGCLFPALPCDDGNACTTDSCVAGECTHAAIACDDNDVCNGVEACNPVTGCYSDGGLNCNDFSECTQDICDPVFGCMYFQADCGDNNACTSDYCTMADGCLHVLIECGDTNPCTLNTCDPQVGCIWSWLEGCCEGNWHCDPGIECVENQCDVPEEDVIEVPDVAETVDGDVEDAVTADGSQDVNVSDSGEETKDDATGHDSGVDAGGDGPGHDDTPQDLTQQEDQATGDDSAVSPDTITMPDKVQPLDQTDPDAAVDGPGDDSSDPNGPQPTSGKGGSGCSGSNTPTSASGLCLAALLVLAFWGARRRR